MVIAFFDTARASLDPVLQAIDGYRQLDVNADGTPSSPDHVAQKLTELASEEVTAHLGACLSATTNLGMAYVHSFRLLGLMSRNEDVAPPSEYKPDLVKLFDALPVESQKTLGGLFERVGAQDFELEISTVTLPEISNDEPKPKERGLRATLDYWQRNHMLQDSHTFPLVDSANTAMRIFIPLRSLLVLDLILAELVAPKLDQDYKTMDQQLSSNTALPVLKWDGNVIFVSLPDKLGRVHEARWNPEVTSVVRIRKADTNLWTPGFEIPFNQCSFVDLEPNAKYEVQITHKSRLGESEPVIESIETANTE